jgi:hypothetical protein
MQLACRVNKPRIHTHSKYIIIIALFYGNNGFATAPLLLYVHCLYCWNFLTLHRPCYPALPFCYYRWSHWLVHLVNSCDLLISLRFYKSTVSGDDIWQWVRMQYIGPVTWCQIRLTVWTRSSHLESLQQVQDGNIMFIYAILRVMLSIRHDQAWPQKFVT